MVPRANFHVVSFALSLFFLASFEANIFVNDCSSCFISYVRLDRLCVCVPCSLKKRKKKTIAKIICVLQRKRYPSIVVKMGQRVSGEFAIYSEILEQLPNVALKHEVPWDIKAVFLMEDL